MKTIDLDTLSTITGGTTYQPLDLSMPPMGKTAGGGFPGNGPTIFNPRPSDILGGNPRPRPDYLGPRNPFQGIVGGR
jgi:hypothetical protein